MGHITRVSGRGVGSLASWGRRWCGRRPYLLGAFLTGVLLVAVPTSAWATQIWKISPSPNGTGGDELYGVSCISVKSCKAVGVDGTSTLIESWNGTAWTIQTSPNASSSDLLTAVSCVSAKSCTAVGYYSGDASVDQTLVESWNGRAWSIVPSPDGAPGASFLFGVSCVSASSCTAVGYVGQYGNPSATLIESWNGTAWTIQSSPKKGTGSTGLYGVSCRTGACQAVGWYTNSSGVARTLVDSWNGTAWSVVSSPNKGGAVNNRLNAVSCGSASSCMAVGYYTSNGATLTESWNGTTWTAVPSPNHGTEGSELAGVSCVSATACTADGAYGSGGVSYTLIESWNGSGWKIHPSPSPGSSALDAVSCVAVCTAVGYDTSPWSTLVERN